MPNTVVLDPIPDEEEKALGIQNFHKIAKMLSNIKSNDTKEFAIFDDFLCKLDMDLAYYWQAMIPHDIQILQSRLLTAQNATHPPDLDLIHHLFTTRAECD